jgi:hypothetical protein
MTEKEKLNREKKIQQEKDKQIALDKAQRAKIAKIKAQRAAEALEAKNIGAKKKCCKRKAKSSDVAPQPEQVKPTTS